MRQFGSALWHMKHMIIHVLLALGWVGLLRFTWDEISYSWIWLAAVASIIPDVEHIWYFLTYGKSDVYTKQVMLLVRSRKWNELIRFFESHHKQNTNLVFHTIYTVMVLAVCTSVSIRMDSYGGAVLFGSMTSHYIFDMGEDMLLLGHLNSNWTRIGKKRSFDTLHTI